MTEKPAPVVAEVRRAPEEVPLISQAQKRGELSVEIIAEWFRHQDVAHSQLQRQCVEFLLAAIERLQCGNVTAVHALEASEAELFAFRTRLRGLEQQWREIAGLRPDATLFSDGMNMTEARWWWHAHADELARLLTTPEEP
jgi:hypothetical protein